MIDFITHHAGVIGLLFFFCFFMLMVLWLIVPSAAHSQDNAYIPLNEDE